MSRILALQNMPSYVSEEETTFNSNTSGTCSDQSSGGTSSCSQGCDELAEMDW